MRYPQQNKKQSCAFSRRKYAPSLKPVCTVLTASMHRSYSSDAPCLRATQTVLILSRTESAPLSYTFIYFS